MSTPTRYASPGHPADRQTARESRLRHHGVGAVVLVGGLKDTRASMAKNAAAREGRVYWGARQMQQPRTERRERYERRG
jgi:hypothetical protein